MQKTVPKLEYEVCEGSSGGIPAIIVAAGSFLRMQGTNKQLVQLLGIPVIARTLMAFENSPFVSKIILVARAEDIPEMQLIGKQYMIGKLTDITEGGSDRQTSVLHGISRLDHTDTRVLIHDGARPLVSNLVIGGVAAALDTYDAAVCAVPVYDTVKRTAADGTVKETVDRTALYTVQTPQGVDVAKYKTACSNLRDDTVFTDDASIMENAGFTVRITAGSRRNIKITTPDDLILAEALIRGKTE